MKYDAPKEFGILSTMLTSASGNSTYKKLAVHCSEDQPRLMVNQSLVLRINICGENRQFRQARNR
jgi:hypothetical protein